MTIPAVTGGATITSTWGNSVADALNAQVDRMAVVANHSTAQNVSNATVTPLALDSETLDTHAMHDVSTNNSRLTIPVGGAGLWMVGYACSWDSNTAGTSREAFIRRNGVGFQYFGYTKLPAGYANASHCGSHLGSFADGDYFELCVSQDSGGTRTIRGTNTVGQLIAVWAYRLGD